MNRYRYLIVGGGMTADAAVRGIRKMDPEGTIGLVGREKDPPYNRPPLSKALWKGKPLDSIWRKTESQQVDLHLGRKIVALDADRLCARDEQGNEYCGEKILLATGGTPRRLPFGGNDIIYYRSLESYRRLAALSAEHDQFAIIGGGFIGAEVGAALAMNGKKVTMLFPEDAIGARIYPPEIAGYLNTTFREKGVEVLAGENVTGMTARGGRQVLQTASGREVAVDGVVAGIGILPNVELAQAAGLQVGNGIVVDETLQTSHANIYAAGDVAEFYNPALDKRMRVEHEDNANRMGMQAGRNMAGASEPYRHLPFFYTDLFDLGYEAVGELDSRLETAVDWAEPFQKGIIYYFKDERVRGVLLWNVWKKLDAAQALIARPGPFRAQDLRKETAPDWKIAF
jgi:NADPH-dependent 2,4-dienoyl-CoA reductase/sulfur reductase-like enzyme